MGETKKLIESEQNTSKCGDTLKNKIIKNTLRYIKDSEACMHQPHYTDIIEIQVSGYSKKQNREVTKQKKQKKT